jgi:C-terminal processing protease CtpA/Prc
MRISCSPAPSFPANPASDFGQQRICRTSCPVAPGICAIFRRFERLQKFDSFAPTLSVVHAATDRTPMRQPYPQHDTPEIPATDPRGGRPAVSRRTLIAGIGAGAVVSFGAFEAFAAPDPQAYVRKALDVMQRHSIRRKEIDWPRFRAATQAEVSAARSLEDTYPAIRAALEHLGDGHSLFLTPAKMKELSGGPGSRGGRGASQAPSGKRLDGPANNPAGYLVVPSFVSLVRAEGNRFADRVQGLMKEVDDRALAGWIVDLRGNMGGNMWPMVAGLGPLIGEGRIGSFVDPDGQGLPWFYRNGACGISGRFISRVSSRVTGKPYRLLTPEPKVAVLTGPVTASSGEAVVVAFRGRPKTMSFGAPTQGVSTSNRMFKLGDGAGLFLTDSVMADRTGRKYGASIEPDRPVAAPPAGAGGDDPVVAAALAWLRAG